MKSFFSVVVVIFSGCISTGLFYDIPQYVYDLCGYADICNRTSSKQLPPGQTSCCASCSCRSDCGLTLNCCFDHLDEYKLVEKGLVSCLKPINSEFDPFNPPMLYMVTSCDFSSGNSSKSNLCDWKKGSRSNNLQAPVTDLSTNLTYVNEACAKCNNVEEFVKWNYFFLNHSSHWSLMDSATWALETNIERNKGIKVFVPTEDIWKVSRECYLLSDEPCEDTNPYFEDCHGFNSPVRTVGVGSTVYRNIACMRCVHGVFLHIPETCEEKIFGKNTFSGLLTVLLNTTVLESASTWRESQLTKPKPNHGRCQHTSVASRIKDRCLQIYCPEGMVNTANGCQYAFAFWYRSVLTMRVKLRPTPGTMLPVDVLKHMSEAHLQAVDRWIFPPCRRLQPLFYQIYYENSSLTFVKSFDVYIRKPFTSEGFSPAEEFPKFHRCVTKLWVMRIWNTSYTFVPEMGKFYDYVQDGREVINWKQAHGVTDFIKPKIYDKLTFTSMTHIRSRRGRALTIKKTFFCRQVRLPMEEVEINVEEVRILATNKTLGNNEYNMNNITFIDSNLGMHGSSVSICLDDYVTSSGVYDHATDTFTKYVAQLCILAIVLDILRAC